MSSFINESIFHIKHFTDSNSIKQLEKYMLSNENRKQILSCCDEPIKEIQKIEIIEQKPKNDNIISPRMEDGLFWCAFIAGNCYKDFINIGTKYKMKELEEKQKIIKLIQQNPHCMKSTNFKITNIAIQEIMSDLMTDKKTSLQSFIALCILYKVHIIIVNEANPTYIEYNPDKSIELPIHIINRTIDGFYNIDTDTKAEGIQKVRDTMIRLESYEKPFKGISTYKVVDLEEFAEKLELDLENTKFKKPELFQKIYEMCLWKKL